MRRSSLFSLFPGINTIIANPPLTQISIELAISNSDFMSTVSRQEEQKNVYQNAQVSKNVNKKNSSKFSTLNIYIKLSVTSRDCQYDYNIPITTVYIITTAETCAL